MAAVTWRGAAATQEVVNAGPLALIEPSLDQLDIEAVIDRHLPPDPQLKYAHAKVLRLLLQARLCQPTALVNVASWAEKSGADIFANIPADKLKDDRLGRALDAFFEQRHSILGSVTAPALQLTGLALNRLHFDPSSNNGAAAATRRCPASTTNSPCCGIRSPIPPITKRFRHASFSFTARPANGSAANTGNGTSPPSKPACPRCRPKCNAAIRSAPRPASHARLSDSCATSGPPAPSPGNW